MAEPAKVRVKRRADEAVPDTLLLESRKRAATPLRYVRDLGQHDFATSNQEKAPPPPPPPPPAAQDTTNGASGGGQNTAPVRRMFHLNKRKAADGSVATFIEKKVRRVDDGVDAVARIEETPAPLDRPLKQPSKRARVTAPTNKPAQHVQTESDRVRMEELADYMHQAALEEIRRERDTVPVARSETRPTRVAAPRLSGQQSRALHRQRVVTNGAMRSPKEIGMEDETDYVYDTYILAPAADLGAVQSSLGNVGYLVITEEDESVWQSYLEDELSEEEGDSADEDENAEDFYGADYPEDELDSDDEFGVNAYGFRGRGASDEEEWDEETGEFSDDEGDGLERKMGRSK